MAAWSLDGSDTRVAVGREEIEAIPGLSDPAVLKVAHNAQFERVCFSAFFGLPVGQYLDPEAWEDTAAIAAVAGYPRGLGALAVALGAQEKDEAGTALINWFCKPDRKGHRRMPQDHPEKWDQFVAYCAQDVDTLRDIHDLLPGWPSDLERRVFMTDQRVNDRGIKVDLEMAEACIAADEEGRARAGEELKDLLGIDNPGSVPQITAALEKTGLKLPSLRADGIKKLLASGELTKVQTRARELRQLTALVAARKYSAALGSSSEDGRLRGQFRFFGAHTGRWCLTGDHEVLTPSGWVRLDEWAGGPIATWAEGSGVAFTKSDRVEFPYSGHLVSLESKRWSQLSTPDHRMVWQDRHNQIRKSTVDGLPARFGLPLAGQRKRTTGQLDEWLLRTMVMVQADGHYTADGDLKLKFAKQRKVERCKTLLRRAGISYYCRVGDNGDRKDYYHLFTIQSRHLPLALRMFRNKEFGWWLLDEDPGVFFSELPNWDGTRYSDNSVQYCTTSKINADIIQAFAHLSMIVASRSVKPATGGNSEAHYLQLWSGAGPFTVSRGNSQRVP